MNQNDKNYKLHKKNIFLCLNKMKSSIKNNYCLFCRAEITDQNHCCEEINVTTDKLVSCCLKLEISKEILDELNDEIFKNQEFVQNIKNKLIAYNI